MKLALSFDDVLIQPCFSSIKSRKDVNTRTQVASEKYKLGVISSNMDTVTDNHLADAMIKYGAGACLHRFCSIEDNIKMFKACSNKPWASVGLGSLEFERGAALIDVGAETLLIDVAHGASMEVVNQTKAFREKFGNNINLIVGNFANYLSLTDFRFHLGGTYVDAIKVGVGGGSCCETRIVTGCGAPTLSSIIDCARAGISIIADGGIRNSADFCKSLAAGADAIMVGRLLAGTIESASELMFNRPMSIHGIINRTVSNSEYLASGMWGGEPVKKYRGSASEESYIVQGKIAGHRTPEGASMYVPFVGSAEKVLQQLDAGLRSSMSYVGASDLSEYRQYAELIQITNAGHIESQAHGNL